jgi:hypothetical protein
LDGNRDRLWGIPCSEETLDVPNSSISPQLIFKKDAEELY